MSASTAALALQKRVLSYWFQDYKPGHSVPKALLQRWFAGTEEVDEHIRTNFKKDRDALFEEGKYEDELSKTAHGTLSMIILLDQFSRNLYRNSPKSFEADPKCVTMARRLIDTKMENELHPLERLFVYIPFEHAEDINHQKYAIKKFEEVVELCDEHCRPMAESFVTFGQRHKVVIEKFGRFPHRNEVVGRVSTQEEIDYLQNGGENFSKAS
ncbi:hypothetical protein K7432_014877 [Basidiobolus ranarum]|uniref:DUF924-domain-containing protein n=1 Tax=Basidiobolus ranarum TaxID=34480 RepID=A0ABR2WGY8_9FUNG